MKQLTARRIVPLKTLSTDTQGSFAILMALLLVPLMLMIGFAVDYLRGTNYRAKAAEALDIALLMTAQEYAYDKTIDVTAKTQANLDANWTFPSMPVPVVAAITLPNNNIKGTVTSSIPTSFMKIIGINSMPINTTSQVSANTKDLELVLVLDNTGSMNTNNRIGTLRTAASNLVSTVMGTSSSPDNIKIGVVPFTQYVNVGMDKAGQPWLHIPDPVHHDGCGNYLEHPGLCTPGTPGTPYACNNSEGVPGTCYSGGTGRTCPPEAYVYSCKNPHDHVWKGCVGSRSAPNNMEDALYDISAKKIPGIVQVGWPYYCPTKITALTTDRSDILDAISAMTGLNNNALTYIPHGLMWGWRVLSNSEPYDEAAEYTDSNVKKVMVLMTDGANTLYPTFPKHELINGNSTKLTTANNFTATACANIKAKGIKLYTVAFEVTDPAIKSILQGCASEAKDYYDATSSSALVQAFRNITLELINLRVTK